MAFERSDDDRDRHDELLIAVALTRLSVDFDEADPDVSRRAWNSQRTNSSSTTSRSPRHSKRIGDRFD